MIASSSSPRHRLARPFSVVVALLTVMTACRQVPSRAGGPAGGATVDPQPAVIAAGEGERRFLRGGAALLLIKVDPVNTGSRRMVLGSSDLPPGDAIGMHRHLQEGEILLVLRGDAEVQLAR